MRMSKKAVSPVISTVLLVLIVIVLATIILLWSRGLIKEAITKEIVGESKRVEQFCSEVGVESILNEDGSFGFSNNGNVPIYSVNVKLTSGGNSEIKEIDSASGGSVNPGFATFIEDPDIQTYENYEEVKIIPVLLGKTKSGGIEPFECPEINGIII